MQKLKIILTVIPLIIFSCFARGNNPDSLHSFNSFKLFKLNNYWLETGNIAGATFNSNPNIAFVKSGYKYKSGDFHRMRESTDMGKFYLHSESFKQIKSISFYGSFSYTNSNEEGMLWNGVFDPYRGNPYVIGDSVSGGTYHKETYKLIGGLARKINTHLTIGAKINYFVGIGAKQKDPRPKNTVMDFSFNPSAIYTFSKIKIGFDAGYRNRKEQIEYSQIATDNPDPTFFTFKGYGFFNSEIDYSVDRFYTEKEYFGGFQIESNFLGMKSLTELRGSYSLEGVEDGSSVIIKEDGGDWKSIQLKLNHQSMLRKNNSIHKFNVLGSFCNGDGIEYTQKQEFDDDRHPYYVTLSKNLKFNRVNIFGQVKYNYLKLISEAKINWEIETYAGVVLNQEKYHYIPEIFSTDFMNLDAGLKAIKNFYFKSVHVATEIGTSYLYNLSGEIQLSNNQAITKKQVKELYSHDYDYYTSDLLKIAGGITAGFNVKGAKNMDQLYIKAYYERWQTMNEENMGFITGTLGIVF